MASTLTRFLVGSALVAGLALGGTALASAQDDGSTTTVPDTEATTPEAGTGTDDGTTAPQSDAGQDAERGGDRQRPDGGDCEHGADGAAGDADGATADAAA